MSDGTSTAPLAAKVSGTFPRDPRLFVRDHLTALRDTLREAAEEHHRRHIPWHFTKFAPAKYGYVKRNQKYLGIKLRSGHGDIDNVFTGATRTQVTTSRQVTATSKGARLIMRLPFSGGTGRFRLRPGMSQLSDQQKQVVNRIEEIRAIAPDEVQYLADFIAVRYAARANAPGMPYRVRNRASRV